MSLINQQIYIIRLYSYELVLKCEVVITDVGYYIICPLSKGSSLPIIPLDRDTIEHCILKRLEGIKRKIDIL